MLRKIKMFFGWLFKAKTSSKKEETITITEQERQQYLRSVLPKQRNLVKSALDIKYAMKLYPDAVIKEDM